MVVEEGVEEDLLECGPEERVGFQHVADEIFGMWGDIDTKGLIEG